MDYAATGRTRQKTRTRDSLVAALRRLMADGRTPTVEEVAEAAGTSRTTAYRYFPTQSDLVIAAFPETSATSLLPEDAPADDVEARVRIVLAEQFRIVREWEPQLRASLRLSLEPGAESLPLRGGRAIGWLLDALEPLARSRPSLDLRHVAVRIRAVAGIETYVWLTDVAGLSPRAALGIMRDNAEAVLADALSGPL